MAFLNTYIVPGLYPIIYNRQVSLDFLFECLQYFIAIVKLSAIYYVGNSGCKMLNNLPEVTAWIQNAVSLTIMVPNSSLVLRLLSSRKPRAAHLPED